MCIKYNRYFGKNKNKLYIYIIPTINFKYFGAIQQKINEFYK